MTQIIVSCNHQWFPLAPWTRYRHGILLTLSWQYLYANEIIQILSSPSIFYRFIHCREYIRIQIHPLKITLCECRCTCMFRCLFTCIAMHVEVGGTLSMPSSGILSPLSRHISLPWAYQLGKIDKPVSPGEFSCLSLQCGSNRRVPLFRVYLQGLTR